MLGWFSAGSQSHGLGVTGVVCKAREQKLFHWYEPEQPCLKTATAGRAVKHQRYTEVK